MHNLLHLVDARPVELLVVEQQLGRRHKPILLHEVSLVGFQFLFRYGLLLILGTLLLELRLQQLPELLLIPLLGSGVDFRHSCSSLVLLHNLNYERVQKLPTDAVGGAGSPFHRHQKQGRQPRVLAELAMRGARQERQGVLGEDTSDTDDHYRKEAGTGEPRSLPRRHRKDLQLGARQVPADHRQGDSAELFDG